MHGVESGSLSSQGHLFLCLIWNSFLMLNSLFIAHKSKYQQAGLSELVLAADDLLIQGVGQKQQPIAYPLGEVPEWLNGTVSKTVVAFVVTVGSNPTLSARQNSLSSIQ